VRHGWLPAHRSGQSNSVRGRTREWRGHRTELLRSLATQGYRGLQTFWDGVDGHVRSARLGGQRVVVVRGADGAELFYNTALVRRRRATPAMVANPLFGRGAVHGLDDIEHDHRKRVFLECLTREEVQRLAVVVDEAWAARVQTWPAAAAVDVFDEAVLSLGRAACTWAGMRAPADIDKFCRDLAVMVDNFGSASVSAGVRRRRARRRAEALVAEALRDVRLAPPPDEPRPTQRVAFATNLDGSPLDVRTAAVELLNLLRPTVAVAWFVAFAAATIAEHPETRTALCSTTGDPAYREAFAHELRRTQPFVPVLAAKARSNITWQGENLARGHRLILDVWGTNNLPERWPDPDAFDPNRFLDHPHTAFDFVPQGGGEPAHGHRCPGEPATVEILARISRRLADLSYEMAPGDRDYRLDRIPTRPAARLRRR
jgi:fatty-acid peroxygenase